MPAARNHGAFTRELLDYQDGTTGRRAVVGELSDGWYVVECYIGGRCVDRVTYETLTAARSWAKAWV